jgi:hypothetical protein
MVVTMKRPKKSTSLVAPAIHDVPVDQLCNVIGGSPARGTPPRPEIAVIIIAAVA